MTKRDGFLASLDDLPKFDRTEHEATRAVSAGSQRAQAIALRILAERECPGDIKEWGRAHGIPTFAEVTWLNGFEAGMRVACLDANQQDALIFELRQHLRRLITDEETGGVMAQTLKDAKRMLE